MSKVSAWAYFRDLDKPILLREVRRQFLQDSAHGAVLAQRLSPWCEDGSFANLFDGPSQVDFSAPVLVFDLKRVMQDQRDPDLAAGHFQLYRQRRIEPLAAGEP